MMLAVIGSSPQAIATAAAAAALSGEAVALDTTLSAAAPPRSLATGRQRVVLPDGSVHIVELITDSAPAADAVLLFASPDELHHRGSELARRLGSAPTLYAPATFAGWATLVRARKLDSELTGVLAGFPAVGDVAEDHIRVRGLKQGLPCGGPSTDSARALVATFRSWLRDLVPVSPTAAELSSSNVIVHGPLLLAHLTQLTHTAQTLRVRVG
jgi:hypothetical protein